MTKTTIGIHIFELKPILLMVDMATINVFDLYCLGNEMNNEDKIMETLLSVATFKQRCDPLITACIVEGDVGLLTYEEYVKLFGECMKIFQHSLPLPKETDPKNE